MCLRWLFAPACQGNGNHETWRALAMPFSPCRSRKRQSWDLACACDGLFPLPVEEKAIMGLGVRLRWPFPPACRGKVRLRAPWKCSRWPFPPACRRKGNSNPLSWPSLGGASTMRLGLFAASPISTPKWGQIAVRVQGKRSPRIFRGLPGTSRR